MSCIYSYWLHWNVWNLNVAQQTKTELKATNANETTSRGRVELNNEHNQTSKQFTTQSHRHR